MNKTAIKNFAIWARNELIKKVSQKAAVYGIRDKGIKDIKDTSVDGKLLNAKEQRQRHILIEKIEKQGFDNVIEEVAYTWFNRFIALRFMEVNGYLPSMIKVFTDENNDFNPEILSQAVYLDFHGLDKEKIFELKEKNLDEELFKYLLIAQCNDLNSILPGMFQKISDYTELLFPDNLLRDDSVISRMIIDIPEEDWKDQIQIIGWLYQYYNTEPKDKVINIYKGTVAKDDIPYATQIFTPDWIVRYIVDNSLGRYWIERNPNSKLIEKLEYFVPSKSGEVDYIDEEIKAEELKIYDPSVGSGHFIVYAFDVLMEIYRESGYSDNDAVESILRNNLYALDIDTRAYQLAYFSIMMKARQYSRRLFKKNIEPKVYAFVESDDIDRENILISNPNLSEEENKKAIKQLNVLLDEFIDAKNLGSILVLSEYDFDLLYKYFEIEVEDNDNMSLFKQNYSINITKLIVKIAEIIKDRYHVVVTNPPYLNKFNPKLKKYINDNYKDYKADLFSVFMYKGFENLLENGYSGYMTPMVWMFIKSYEKMREYIIRNKTIKSLIQFEYSSFKEATVPLCTCIFMNGRSKFGDYFRLTDFTGGMDVQREKVLEAIQEENCSYFYNYNQDNFLKIPGCPIAYWVSEGFASLFCGQKIGDIVQSKAGVVTGNDRYFLKYWFEVDINDIEFYPNLRKEYPKYVPFQKGGPYRKYYGNNELVIRLSDLYNPDLVNKSVRRGDKDYYFKKGIGWSQIGSNQGKSFRIIENSVCGTATPTIYPEDDSKLNVILGLLNSPVSEVVTNISNPTINLLTSDIMKIPFLDFNEYADVITSKIAENIKLSKIDWDMFEVSWDYKKHPLTWDKFVLDYDNKNVFISSIYYLLKDYINKNFLTTKNNENIVNNIFIKSYKLEDKIKDLVFERDISITKIFDNKKEINEEIKGNFFIKTKRDIIITFLSYFIGNILGRYSLNIDGIVFAGGEFDFNNYQKFSADKDGIIPLTEIEYFSNDVVLKFIKFLETVYSKETLEENLDFIAEALGGKGISRDVIRNYFIKDFYKDHVRTYQKRPIYWMFDSGNKNAFKALIYMHRYEKDTIAKLRTDYIHPTQDLYRSMIEDLEMRKASSSSSEKIKIEKELKDLKDKEAELREYEEKIHHLADQMIEIDLDDGVEHNYEIFKDVLAKR